MQFHIYLIFQSTPAYLCNRLTQNHRSGMTVIGDAIPAKSYRTLAEGEEAYGKYLGLHNHVSDGTFDWELVQVVIIDEKILQGTYKS